MRGSGWTAEEPTDDANEYRPQEDVFLYSESRLRHFVDHVASEGVADIRRSRKTQEPLGCRPRALSSLSHGLWFESRS